MYRRLIATVLLLIMIFNFTIVFAEEIDPRDAGYNDGLIYVLSKYNYGQEIPISPLLPKDSEIYEKYQDYLSTKTQSQRRQFYTDYRSAYREGYREGRELLRSTQPSGDVEVNYAHSFGSILGEIYAYRDYQLGVKSNWLKAIPSNKAIMEIFDLSRESSAYRAVFLSRFRESFKASYEASYEYAHFNIEESLLASAVENGRQLGFNMGSIYGGRDFANNLKADYKRDMPKDLSLISEFNLDNFSKEYRLGFINGFKEGYEEGYRKAYYNSYQEIVDWGREAGRQRGQSLAQEDFVLAKDMNWLRHKDDSAIQREYRLAYYSTAYRGSFMMGFWLGFAEGYEDSYKSLVGEEVNGKIASAIIQLDGGVVASSNGNISMEIQPSTFYKQVALRIERVFYDGYRLDEGRYIKASDIYNIRLSNPSKDLDNSKEIELKFKYHGDWSGGIYKWVGDSWQYIPSRLKEGYLVAEIRPDSLKAGDNLYRILMDRDYQVLMDIRSHWARDEIETLYRRDIVRGYGDQTFKPDNYISRGEFLTLLSRAFNWQLPKDRDNIKNFKDYKDFGYLEGVISYSVAKGYIRGYEDNTFRPSRNITYREVEAIITRLVKDSNFRWSNIAEKLLYQRQVRSNSYASMNNRITRAEVAYMLYLLKEWGY